MSTQPSAAVAPLFLHTRSAGFRHPCCRAAVSLCSLASAALGGLPHFILKVLLRLAVKQQTEGMSEISHLCKIQFKIQFTAFPLCFFRTWCGAKVCLYSEQPCRIWKGALLFVPRCLVVYRSGLRVLGAVGVSKELYRREDSSGACEDLGRLCCNFEKISRGRK